MPRRRKTPKDEGKAKADALKAPETSTTGNNGNTTPASSKSASCGTSSHPVLAGGETRVSTAGESKRQNVAESNASEALQDKRGEKRMGEIHKERSDGGERGPGENKHEKVNEINASTAVQDKRADALKAPETSTTGNNDNTTPASSNSASCGTSFHPVPAAGETRVSTEGESKRENAAESNASEALQDKRGDKRMGEIHKERSDGGERGPGENKHEKVNEINASTAVQDKRAGKNVAEIIKEKSGGGDRGPSRKSGEEETVSLRPSQFESKQKQRDERSSFAGNKGFRQDLSGRNSSVSQSYEGKISSQGRQHGYENRWRGRGGDNEDDSTRIDALGRSL